eukprot:3923357-Pyramimonas_sp.AAC.3
MGRGASRAQLSGVFFVAPVGVKRYLPELQAVLWSRASGQVPPDPQTPTYLCPPPDTYTPSPAQRTTLMLSMERPFTYRADARGAAVANGSYGGFVCSRVRVCACRCGVAAPGDDRVRKQGPEEGIRHGQAGDRGAGRGEGANPAAPIGRHQRSGASNWST